MRALPFTQEVTDFVNKYDQIFVVEQNRDGQLNQLLTIEYPQRAVTLKSVAFGDGMPAAARWVREGILAKCTPKAKLNGGNRKVASKARSAASKPKSGKDATSSSKDKKLLIAKPVTTKTRSKTAKSSSKKITVKN